MRAFFIRTDRKIQKMFRYALHNGSCFAFPFIKDFEQAKEWPYQNKPGTSVGMNFGEKNEKTKSI